MIKIENVTVYGWKEAIRGMRNPMNSWAKSDTGICKGGDFDTFAILSMRNPVGNLVEIGRYYKDSENGLVDISYDEYMERKKAYEEKKGVK